MQISGHLIDVHGIRIKANSTSCWLLGDPRSCLVVIRSPRQATGSCTLSVIVFSSTTAHKMPWLPVEPSSMSIYHLWIPRLRLCYSREHISVSQPGFHRRPLSGIPSETVAWTHKRFEIPPETSTILCKIMGFFSSASNWQHCSNLRAVPTASFLSCIQQL